jgi:hypothetical protein
VRSRTLQDPNHYIAACFSWIPTLFSFPKEKSQAAHKYARALFSELRGALEQSRNVADEIASMAEKR